MREIKFRYLNEIGNMVFLTVWNVNLPLKKENLKKGTELMQFVGLKDKNKKEIYEGDIVQDIDSKRKYIITCGAGRFRLSPISFPADFLSCNVFEKNIKVIGNIYENPELLKEESN